MFCPAVHRHSFAAAAAPLLFFVFPRLVMPERDETSYCRVHAALLVAGFRSEISNKKR